MLLVLRFLFLILFLLLFFFVLDFVIFFVFCFCCGSYFCFWSCSPCSHCFPCSIFVCFVFVLVLVFLLSFVFCFVSSFLFLFLFFLLVVPLGPPIDTQKRVQFFCPISKNVPARLGVWKKKVSGPPWPPIVINLIFSSIDSIGHFCHALMHAQHAKYDLERPRLTTWVASQHM